MWLEALFVNVEFYPGVLACRTWDRPEFAFGSAMLFSADDFHNRLHWDALGARMAEDNLLGLRMTPVHISSVTLETLAAETRWADALVHYLRWHKTVRWCRPSGYAAEIIITPLIGWLVAVAVQPANWSFWLGLICTIVVESSIAACLSTQAGCKPQRRDLIVLAGWSLLRALTWLLCWLPWPVVFRSQRRIWWSLYRSSEIVDEPTGCPCGSTGRSSPSAVPAQEETVENDL
jgi:ceramide glucosyltransferase